MGRARDEAGNIWETDASGNAVRLVQSAAHAGGMMSNPKTPLEVQHLSGQNTVQNYQIATDRAKAPYANDVARAERDKAVADARKAELDAQASGGDVLDPATRTFYAQQVLAGAPMPAIGMGKQAAAARQAIMAEVAHLAGASGLTGADQARQIAHYKAGSGQLANLEKMAGTIGVNEQTALANGQQFLDRSAELPGQTRFSPVNAVSDWIQRRVGGTTISAADAAYNTFVNEYAKVVAGSPSGAGTLSDSARHEAMSTISGSGSLAQKQAAFDQMKADMANRMMAIHGGIDNGYKALTNQPGYVAPDSTQGLALPAQHQGFGGPGGGDPSGGGGAAPNQPGLTPGGAGGRTFYTQRDQALADEAHAAFLRGGTRADLDAIAARYGAQPFGPELDQALKMRAQGNLGVQFAPRPTGHEETGLTGAVANALPNGVGSFAAGAGNALTLGQLDHIAELTGSSQGGTQVAERIAKSDTAPYLLGSLTGDVAGNLLTGGILGRLSDVVDNPVAKALLAKPITADTTFGALSGAGSSDDPLHGLVEGALLGAGGSYAGSAAGKYAAGLRRPVTELPLEPGEQSVMDAINKTGRDTVIDDLTNAGNLNVPTSIADVSPQVNSLTGAAIRRSPTAAGLARDTLIPRSRGQYDRFVQSVGENLGPVENIPQRSDSLIQQAKAAAQPLYEAAYAAPAVSSPEIDSLLSTPFGQSALSRARTIAANERRDPAELGFSLDGDGNVSLNPVNLDLHGNLATAQSAHDAALANVERLQLEARRGNGGTRLPEAVAHAEQTGAALQDAQSALASQPTPGVAASGPVYSPQTLDYTKRGMDDVLEQYRNPITGKLVLDEAGRAQNGVLRQFLSEADRLNPAYASARAAYAGPAAERDALMMGQDALNLNPDQLGLNVSNASPSRLDQMRLGFQSGLVENAGKLRYSSNPFESQLGTPAMEQRLSSLYDGAEGSDVARLLAQRDLEGQLAGSSNRLIGNSLTAERGIADDAFATSPLIEGGLHATAALATHGASIPGTAARLVGPSIRDRLALGLGQRAIEKADQIAPIALNIDPQQSIAQILAMEQKQQDYSAAKALLGEAGVRPGGLLGSAAADALGQTLLY